MSKFNEFSMPEKITKQQQAQKLRAEFPLCAESVDLMRDLFGSDVQVLAMHEDGKTIKPKNYKSDNDHPMWLSGERFLELGRKSSHAAAYAKGAEKNANKK